MLASSLLKTACDALRSVRVTAGLDAAARKELIGQRQDAVVRSAQSNQHHELFSLYSSYNKCDALRSVRVTAGLDAAARKALIGQRLDAEVRLALAFKQAVQCLPPPYSKQHVMLCAACALPLA
jgi:hypothetical protein